MSVSVRVGGRYAAALACVLMCELLAHRVPAAHGETMSGALKAAYQGNPEINQQRAATRADDEGVSKAKSGYRPHVRGTASFGHSNTQSMNDRTDNFKTGDALPNLAQLNVTETIFDGNHTTSEVTRAESSVLAAREQLRDKEQDVLQSGATAYMDVLRDTALLDLNKNNIEVLIVRLREARARFRAQEVTSTDVAQVASSLASARSTYFTTQATLFRSMAAYRRIIGTEPHRLEAARPIDALLPPNLGAALSLAFVEHPRLQAALHQIDVAAAEVHLAESALYPTISAEGQAKQSDEEHGNPNRDFFDGRTTGHVSVPVYTGGVDYARIREAKERLGKARLEAEVSRDQIRASLASSWGQLEATKALIHSAQTAVKASEAAFIGTREEAKLGQRTTLDVLRALQTLLQARTSLVSAQRDRVVDSYAVMAAAGRLSAVNLGLDVPVYDPTVHFNQVKDKWIGLRTPDGR